MLVGHQARMFARYYAGFPESRCRQIIMITLPLSLNAALPALEEAIMINGVLCYARFRIRSVAVVALGALCLSGCSDWSKSGVSPPPVAATIAQANIGAYGGQGVDCD